MERSACRLAAPPLSLLVPYGPMPRTRLLRAKLPNGPVNHMQRREEASASSCSVTTGCQGHDCRGGLTGCSGIRGLGLDEETSGPLRTCNSAPFCPPLRVQVLLWGLQPDRLCGQRPRWPAQTGTLSGETKFEGQRVSPGGGVKLVGDTPLMDEPHGGHHNANVLTC